MSSLAAELELLRFAARHCLPGNDPLDNNVPQAIAEVNWQHVLWLGRQQRALLFLREALRLPPLSANCPNFIREQLDELAAVAQLQSLARTGEILRLHDRFQQYGIPFVVADDWMFLRCFADGQTLSETTTEIRCVLHSAHARQARELCTQAGHSIAKGSFQVAVQGQTPIEFIEDAGLLVSEQKLVIGNRLLDRLTPGQWWRLLATRSQRVDLFRDWQRELLARHAKSAAVATNHPTPDSGLAVEFACLPQENRATMPLPPAPFVPSPAPVVQQMLALAEAKPGDVVCDLGCGDGSLVITAAKDFGARAIGLDCSPALIVKARALAEAEGVADRTSFVCGDLFAADLTGVSVICLYLLPAFYGPLRAGLLSRARPGTRVVSHDYVFPEWPPEKTELVRSSPTRMAQIYLWHLT